MRSVRARGSTRGHKSDAKTQRPVFRNPTKRQWNEDEKTGFSGITPIAWRDPCAP